MTETTVPRPVVVVPLYRQLESPDEKLALRVAIETLAQHPLIGAVPQRLADAVYWGSLGVRQLEIFADADFASIDAYNRLMLDPRFYQRFAAYSHLLLCQTDALVFRDELMEWCGQPYDYIGAPWAYPWAYWPPWLSVLKHAKARLYQYLDWRGDQSARLKWAALRVGNGGFSLRRIAPFLQVLAQPPATLACYREHGLPGYPEDFFWGIDVNREGPRIRVPDWRTALAFAVESAPELALRQLGKLPFGVHGWDRGFRDFWLRQLAAAGKLESGNR